MVDVSTPPEAPAAAPPPFPALTPAQRLHLEVNGYVVIENLLTPEAVADLIETTYAIEAGFRRTGSLPERTTSLFSTSREYFRIDNLPHLAPCYLDYVAHPRIVGMAEEIVGGPVRLEQSDVHIRRPPADGSPEQYTFHRGWDPDFGFTAHGLSHFPFVKALTNLTDLGPDDGGTSVIAGSHKLGHVPEAAMIAAAMDDPRLIHQVIAPAGSTLLFYESLIHSNGINRSGNDRILIIAGYTPPVFVPWSPEYDPDPDLVASASPEVRALLTGEMRWAYRAHPRHRPLDAPAQS